MFPQQSYGNRGVGAAALALRSARLWCHAVRRQTEPELRVEQREVSFHTQASWHGSGSAGVPPRRVGQPGPRRAARSFCQRAALGLSPRQPPRSFRLFAHWQPRLPPRASTRTRTNVENINSTSVDTRSRQYKEKKRNFKKSPGSAFLETSCITTSKNPSSKNQSSTILGIWARDRTTFPAWGGDAQTPFGKIKTLWNVFNLPNVEKRDYNDVHRK